MFFFAERNGDDLERLFDHVIGHFHRLNDVDKKNFLAVFNRFIELQELKLNQNSEKTKEKK